MEANLTGNLFIEGPSGRLEAIFKTAGPAVERIAIVAHPHPQHGGAMHNKVVYRAAQALNQVGCAALRFNFRGVGLSDGVYDAGRGERDDLRAAIDYIAGRFPAAELLVGGFSFGSWVGLDIGSQDERVSKLLGIGVPTRILQVSGLSDCVKPKLFVQGTNDEYGPIQELEAWYEQLAAPKQLAKIIGAGHFFDGRLDEMQAAIRDYFKL